MGGVAPCNANYCVINYRSIGVEFNFTTIFNRHIDSIYIFVKSIKFSHNRDTFGGLKKRRKKKDRFIIIGVYPFRKIFLKSDPLHSRRKSSRGGYAFERQRRNPVLNS